MDNILVLNRLEEFSQSNPEYSIGECLYAVLRERNSKIRDVDCVKFLREVDNNTIFTAIEKAIKNELEE